MRFVVALFLIALLLIGCVTQQPTVRSGGAATGTVYHDFDIGMDSLANDLKKHLMLSLKTTDKKIAVVSLVNAEGKPVELGRDIAAALQKRLFDPTKYRLLERERIDSLLKEVEFSQSGMVQEKDTALLGADVLLVGNISEQSNRYVVYCRMVDLTSGEILAVAELQLYARPSVTQRYRKPL